MNVLTAPDPEARAAIHTLAQIMAEAISFMPDVTKNERVYIRLMNRIAEIQDGLDRGVKPCGASFSVSFATTTKSDDNGCG